MPFTAEKFNLHAAQIRKWFGYLTVHHMSVDSLEQAAKALEAAAE